MIADCQRFYGVNITRLPGHEAFRLISRVACYISGDQNGRPLSAIGQYAKELKELEKEETLVPMSAIMEFDGEIAEVVTTDG